MTRMRTFAMMTMLLLCRSPAVPADAPAASAAAASDRQLSSFKKAIRELYDVKEKAWAAGDAETIVTKFYSVDALSVGEGDPATIVGRDALRKAYLQYVKDVPYVRIESVRTVVNGDAGWDWTNFYHTPKAGKEKDYPPSPLRILFVFSKENGTWICKGEAYVNGRFGTDVH